MSAKSSIIIVGLLGATAVIFGAFGAHFLKERLSEMQLASFKTGVDYHFYHSLALFSAIAVRQQLNPKLFKFIIYSFLIGILCFSGSLYLLSCRELIGLSSYKWLGPITPIGGMFFISGWILIVIAALKR